MFELMSTLYVFCGACEGGKAEETRGHRKESCGAYEKTAVFAKNGDTAILQKYADAASERETRER